VRDARTSELEHRVTLIEAGQRPAEMLREKAGPARDVERLSRRKCRERLHQRSDLLVPAGAVAVDVEARSFVPVVVLRRTRVVVGLHHS
jgi:hypothetical protein